jgi:hypothetical protein
MKWLGIGLLSAIIIWFIVSRFRVDGFQPTAPDVQTTMKDEACDIIKGLQSSIQYKYDNFDSANMSKETKDVLEISLNGINEQLKAQGCK